MRYRSLTNKERRTFTRCIDEPCTELEKRIDMEFDCTHAGIFLLLLGSFEVRRQRRGR